MSGREYNRYRERDWDRDRSRSPDRKSRHWNEDREHRERDRDRSDRGSRDRNWNDNRDVNNHYRGGNSSDRNHYPVHDRGDGSNNSSEYNEAYHDGGGNEPETYSQWDPPNKTLMLRVLASWIDEHDIMAKLAEGSFQAKEVRLMRRRDTGESRGFAFVEFETLEEATHWMEYTQGSVDFGRGSGAVDVIYSLPKEGNFDRSALIKNDWMCSKCGVTNFRRRDSCFKCSTLKDECIAPEMVEEVSLQPTSSILLRNLANLTTEERVLSTLATITSLPIKSVKILRDPIYSLSRGVCAVELNSISESSQLFQLLSSMTDPPFLIEGRQVALNYGRKAPQQATATSVPFFNNAHPQSVSSFNGPSVMATNSAASMALAAAQWTNQSATKPATSVSLAGNQQLVTVNGIEYSTYPPPDTSKYQFEPTSGYFYDPSTGFYYDAQTHYYFNPATLKYCYWDATHSTYLPAPTSHSAEQHTPAQKIESETKESKKKDDKKTTRPSLESDTVSDEAPEPGEIKSNDKVKVARKVAKDMERWAKTLNQKKDYEAKPLPPSEAPTAPSSDSLPCSSTDAADKPTSSSKISFSFGGRLSSVTSKQPEMQESKQKATVTEACSDFSATDDAVNDVIDKELEKMINWDKLACLLCKRGLASKEQLTKHISMSDLHKENVAAFKASRLAQPPDDDEQDDGLAQSSTAYRDRAKERRLKYGQPAQPDPSEYGHPRRGGGGRDVRPSSSGLPQIIPEKVDFSATDNVGSKMMKAMGWQEGKGLGKRDQPVTSLIEVEQRGQSVGLGYKDSARGAQRVGENYKDAVKRAMAQRFKELNETD